MVKITFPDGSVREYEQGVTGLQIAESISPALARNVVSCGVNGETVELDRPINEDASVELYKFEDEQGKHTFWHTSAHLLAEALQELYPGIQFGFGPAVESGFFYDVMPAEGQVISENDFAKIEAKMMELAKKNEPVVRKEIAKADALAEFKADGQQYKCEHIEQDLEDGTITTYTQGNFTDLCRGPLVELLTRKRHRGRIDDERVAPVRLPERFAANGVVLLVFELCRERVGVLVPAHLFI